MKTTSVFVDILIIGLFATVWIALFASSFLFTPDSLTSLLASNSIAILFILVSSIYVLGILFDYVHSALFGLLKSEAERQLYSKVSIVRILDYKPELQKFLNNHYSRLRISRATVIHVPLISFSLVFFVNHESIDFEVQKSDLTVLVLSVGLALWALAIYSFRLRDRVYKKYIEEVLDILK